MESTISAVTVPPRVAAKEWIENRAPSGWLPGLDLRELWSFRELALVLALRDLRVRYKQTLFGVAWAVIQPLAAAAIFTIVFGRLAGLPSDGFPYAVFVYSGLVLWAYFSGALDAAAQSLVENRELVTKVYFPALVVPLALGCPVWSTCSSRSSWSRSSWSPTGSRRAPRSFCCRSGSPRAYSSSSRPASGSPRSTSSTATSATR